MEESEGMPKGMKMFMGSIEGLKEKLQEEENQNNIAHHYGETDEFFDKTTNEMLCDMIMNEKKSKVIDKWFKKLDNTDRVKVLCYVGAVIKYLKMSGCDCCD